MTLLTIANTYSNDGKYSDAERLFKESLSLSEKAVGAEHPDVASALEEYATLLRKQSRIPEADQMGLRAREIRTRTKSTAAYP